MISRIKNYPHLFLTILCLGLVNIGISQELFTVLPKRSVVLNTEQSQRLQKIKANDYAAEILYVKVGDLPSIQQNGNLAAKIPIEDTRYSFTAKHVRDFGNGEYSWTGDLTDINGKEGSMSIRSMGGKIFGHIDIDEAFYRIVDMSGGLWTFIQIIDDEPAVCGNSSITPNIAVARDTRPDVPAPANTDCDINVLILYTTEAFIKEPDILQLGNDCIEQANDILMNSAVATNDVRLKLQAILPTNFEENSNNMGEDLDVDIMGYSYDGEWIEDANATPVNTEVNTLRNQHGADIVVVLTGKEYDYLGRSYGVSGLIDFHNFYQPELAFCIVDVSTALGKRKTFTHEIGHLLGLHHEDQDSRYGKGYFFEVGGLFGNKDRITVMHKMGDFKRRKKFFSNPDVEYKGEPTGTGAPGDPGERNSARKIRESGCIVAGFRQDPIPIFSISMDFAPCCKPYVVPGEVRTYTAYVNNGQTPYQYEWRVSSDGFNYGSVLSMTNQLTRDYYGYQHGDRLFIKVTGTSADGQTDESVFLQEVFDF